MIRERQLIYGGTGTGKSGFWVDLFFYPSPIIQQAKFFVVDADFAVEAMIPDAEEYSDRLKVLPTLELKTMRKSLRPFLARAEPGDFIVFDMQSSVWRMVQTYVKQTYFKLERDDAGMFIETQDFRNQRAGFWAICNDVMWNYFAEAMKSKAHMIALAGQRPLRTEGMLADDPQTIQVYSKTGQVPIGSSQDGHYFHTILHTSYTSDKNYRVTTVKDRFRAPGGKVVTRKQLNKEVVTDKLFPEFYLKDVAGWNL